MTMREPVAAERARAASTRWLPGQFLRCDNVVATAFGESGAEPSLDAIDCHLAVRVGAHLNVREVLALNRGDLDRRVLGLGSFCESDCQHLATGRRGEDQRLWGSARRCQVEESGRLRQLKSVTVSTKCRDPWLPESPGLRTGRRGLGKSPAQGGHGHVKGLG